MSSPTVSVIIPAHNAAATLQAQLDAVAVAAADPGAPRSEVIIVDNRSTDDTAAIAARWKAENELPVTVVAAAERASEAYARNVGLEHASADLLAYCDADDKVSEGWLAAMADALATADYATGPLDLDSLNPDWLRATRGQTSFDRRALFAGTVPYAHGANMGFRRQALVDLGGFDESIAIGADVDIAVRAWESGIDLHFADDAVVAYRLRDSLRGLWRQGRSYGLHRPAFQRRVRHLTTAPSVWPAYAKRAVWLVRHAPLLPLSRARRANWLWVASQLSGELQARISPTNRQPRRPEPNHRTGIGAHSHRTPTP